MEIRRIRQILTHQRGELRTKELRRQFASNDFFPDNLIHLREEQVIQIFDDLASVVGSVDPVAHQYVDGTTRFTTGRTSQVPGRDAPTGKGT
jgi:hypothetical protein